MTHPPGTSPVSLYRNRDYLALVGAQALSITGREMESLVLPLLVLGLTGSPVQVGLIGAAQILPYLVLSLHAGALVDRWDRKRVMIACDGVRALLFASLPVAWLLGSLDLVQLYVVALAGGSAFVFYNIAEISALPQLVARDALSHATSVNGVVEWGGENIGPALGGALISIGRTTVVGAMFAYAAQSVILAASVGVLGLIRRPLRAERKSELHANLLVEIRDGARWLFAHSSIRAMAVLAMALNFLFAPVSLALIVRARDSFHAAPFLIGLMFSLGGVGGLVATLSAPFIRRHARVGAILVSGVVLWAVGLVAVAAAKSMIVLMLAWPVIPAVAGVQDVTGVSYRLALIPDGMQGRVNSVFRLVAWGIRPAALALGGFVIASIGAEQTLWLLALGMAVAAAGAMVSPIRRAK